MTSHRFTVASLATILTIAAFSMSARPAQSQTWRDKGILMSAYRPPQLAAEVKVAHDAGVPDLWKKYGRLIPSGDNALTYFARFDVPGNAPSSNETESYALIEDPTNSGSAWQSAERFVVTRKSLLDLAHHGARTQTLSPLLHRGQDPLAIVFPELGGCRRSAKIITVESISLARGGRFLLAVQNQRDAFRCADLASKDVGLMAYLVSCYSYQCALDGLLDILRLSRGDPHVCFTIRAIIASDYHDHFVSEGLKSDCAQSIAQVEYWRDGGPKAFADMSNGVVDAKLASRPDLYNAIVDMNGVYLVRQELSAIDVADRPYSEAFRILSTQDTRHAQYHGVDGTYAHVMLSVPSKTIGVHARIEAAAAVTRAACAVFLYKSKHGRYPSTLAEAAPTAIDPFDGKPLGYRREANGFVVYSVGPTGQYNGGAFDTGKQHEEAFRYP